MYTLKCHGHKTNSYRKRTNFRGHNISLVKFLWRLIDFRGLEQLTALNSLRVQIFVGLIFVGKLANKS